MILSALLLSAAAPACAMPPLSRPADAPAIATTHVFQNGGPTPVRLWWIDQQGKRVDQGVIAPGGFASRSTTVDHAFVVTDAKGRCRKAIRVGEVFSGSYIGRSRYRGVRLRPGWNVLADQALDVRSDPARGALASAGAMIDEIETVLPPVALAQVRRTPIFLHAHAGPGGMFHRNPEWLIAHGRTVEMVNAIEISDAATFIETAKVQPGSILHELAHAWHARLPAAEQEAIERAYQSAMARGRYLGVRRHDGSTVDAYARTNASEYFAELSEAYFGRNDMAPFTREELTAYDPEGARMVARVWGVAPPR